MIRNVMLATIIILFVCSSIWALTFIPDTQKERLANINKLELKYEKNREVTILRNLALNLAVAAGDDTDNKDLLKKALRYLKKADKALPKDYELMSAYGSTLTVQAAQTSDQGKQLFFVKQGARKMDRAVRKAPQNAATLMYRAMNSLNLPLFLRRLHFAIGDFQSLLALLEDKQSELFVLLKTEENRNSMKARLNYLLGLAYKKNKQKDEARQYLKKSADLKADVWSKKAQLALTE